MTHLVADAGSAVRALTCRRGERRVGFGELLAGLTSGLDSHHESSAVRSTFERLLRRIVPVRPGLRCNRAALVNPAPTRLR